MSFGRWALCRKVFGCRIRELRPTEGGADWPALPRSCDAPKVGDELISSNGGDANSGGGDDDASPNSDKGDNPSHSPNHDGAIGDDTASDGGNRPSRRRRYRSWRPRFSERRHCRPSLRPGRRSLRDRGQARGLPLKVHFAFISPELTASTYEFACTTRAGHDRTAELRKRLTQSVRGAICCDAVRVTHVSSAPASASVIRGVRVCFVTDANRILGFWINAS